MAHIARISLAGTNPKTVDSVCTQIKTISERTGEKQPEAGEHGASHARNDERKGLRGS